MVCLFKRVRQRPMASTDGLGAALAGGSEKSDAEPEPEPEPEPAPAPAPGEPPADARAGQRNAILGSDERNEGRKRLRLVLGRASLQSEEETH